MWFGIKISLKTEIKKCENWHRCSPFLHKRHCNPKKGAVSRYSVISFVFFFVRKNGDCSRKNCGHQTMTARSAARTASLLQLSRANVAFVEQLSFPAALPCGRHYFSPNKIAAKNHRLSWHCRFKMSQFCLFFLRTNCSSIMFVLLRRTFVEKSSCNLLFLTFCFGFARFFYCKRNVKQPALIFQKWCHNSAGRFCRKFTYEENKENWKEIGVKYISYG